MITLQQIKRSRAALSFAGSPDPGLLPSATYTLYEAVEVSELIFLDYRPSDIRSRDKSARDPIDKELGQCVYMAWTTLSHCPGVLTPNIDYTRRDVQYSDLVVSFQMIDDALRGVMAANKGVARDVEMYMTEVIANAYLLGFRRNVDLEAAMWAWVDKRVQDGTRN